MIRVGIITFSNYNTNYGSALQAFALKTFLEQNGCLVTFIDYREFHHTEISGLQKNLKNILRKIYYRLHRKQIRERTRSFELFREQNFLFTPLKTSTEELKQQKEIFDLYICGSDQIWNFSCLGGIRTPYFLDFVPDHAIKISYAASCGDHIFTGSELKLLGSLLQKMDKISLREPEMIKKISEISQKDVELTVDPVFLLSKAEWENMLPPVKESVPENYAVCSFIRRAPENRKLTDAVRKKLKLPILNLSDNAINPFGTYSGYHNSDPLQFLSLVRNAKLLIGNSYHLAAFAIIFRKPFLVLQTEHNQKRLGHLLDCVGCSTCILKDGVPEELCREQIFSPFFREEPLQTYLLHSKEFLLDALKKTEIVRKK